MSTLSAGEARVATMRSRRWRAGEGDARARGAAARAAAAAAARAAAAGHVGAAAGQFAAAAAAGHVAVATRSAFQVLAVEEQRAAAGGERRGEEQRWAHQNTSPLPAKATRDGAAACARPRRLDAHL